MNSIKFLDLISLSNDEVKKLKLIFNSNWNYQADTAPAEVKARLGKESRYFDLLEVYREGKVELIKDSVRTHNPFSQKRFHNGGIIFCFIPYGTATWLLVNAYKVLNDSKYMIDVDEKCMSRFAPYFGRLVVEYQHKSRNVGLKDLNIISENVIVKEILPRPVYEMDQEFPGYDNVKIGFTELEYKLKKSVRWQERLKAVKGVYAITDKSNGKLYIGSASGEDGIFGRWQTYIENGYDRNETEAGEYPNKKFQELVKTQGKAYIRENFQYSILETFTLDTDRDYIIAREQYFKQVFDTKKHGYNSN